MSKLEPGSETSSVMTEGVGDVRAATDLEDGAEAGREAEKAPGPWRPRSLALKTTGWWRL